MTTRAVPEVPRRMFDRREWFRWERKCWTAAPGTAAHDFAARRSCRPVKRQRVTFHDVSSAMHVGYSSTKSLANVALGLIAGCLSSVGCGGDAGDNSSSVPVGSPVPATVDVAEVPRPGLGAGGMSEMPLSGAPAATSTPSSTSAPLPDSPVPAATGSAGSPSDASPMATEPMVTDPEVPGPAGEMNEGTPSEAEPEGANPVTGAPLEELSLAVVVGNGTLGLEWPEIAGATSYNLYWSLTPGAGTTGELIEAAPRGYVHRGLENDVPHYYVVTAILPEGESAPSEEATATPGGEWVLEVLGTGDYLDIATGMRLPAVPIEQRQHVVLLPEGYTDADLPQFHSHANHASGENDVDAWIEEVFTIEPYSSFREAFVVWYLPRASNTQIGGGDTAFGVPLQAGGSLPSVTGAADVTAVELWAALEQHPYPPAAASGVGGIGNVVYHTAAFMIFDPSVGRAWGSGLSTSLPNPNDGRQRIGTAFAMGHAHEFTHAFTGLGDEYIETMSGPPRFESETSNVVATNRCEELPWAHLLAGGDINPDVEELVGAFGTPEQGYHSELLCLLNGTHDNGEFYASEGSGCQTNSCTLRVEDRMCNFCREITAFHVYARAGGLDMTQDAFEQWKSTHRTAFFEHFGFAVPDLVPQSNDVRRPENGATVYEACVP